LQLADYLPDATPETGGIKVPALLKPLGIFRAYHGGASAMRSDIGESPPQDHPHVFLEMSEQERILCP